MATETQIQFIKSTLEELMAEEPTLFLVEIRVKAVNNIKIFLDGDQGITIEKCTRINRGLYRQMEEANTFPEGDFSLEVSSAGVGEPLLMQRQYVKNVGRNVEVKTNAGEIIEGELTAADEHGILVTTITGKGKKTETKQHSIIFENIKTTSVQIKF